MTRQQRKSGEDSCRWKRSVNGAITGLTNGSWCAMGRGWVEALQVNPLICDERRMSASDIVQRCMYGQFDPLLQLLTIAE